jgi:predicted permease
MSPKEARYATLRSFGGVEQVKEDCRDAWGVRFIESLLQDLRFGLRLLAKNPGFTAVAVITLALGIGATTAVFSVVDRLLFRSLPYPEADRLVSLSWMTPLDPNEFMLSYDYVDWRAAQTPFESMTSWNGVADCDLTEQNPVRMVCAQVESSFLTTFGIQPLLGRNFTPDENRPNAPKVALLSYGLWKSRFGSDPGAVGRTFSLDGQPTRIIGVLPADFELPSLASANVLVPELFTDAELSPRHDTAHLIHVFARLKPGITPAQAQGALEPLFQQSLQGVSPQFRKDVHLRVQLLRERQIHDSKLAAWILLAAVFAVLLIACANVANLLLARAALRQREVALRGALGAGRPRLIRQQLTESILLGLIGGAMGCVLADLMLRGFLAIAPEGIPRLQQATLDLRVLLFTLAVSLLSGALFGLAPVLHLPSAEALTGRQVVAGGRSWFRQLLVVAQVAISLVLLAGASLLLRSLWKLQNDPMGIETSHVVTASLVLGQQRYPRPEQQVAFFDELEQRLQRLPGVTALAMSDSLPPGGPLFTMVYGMIQVRGRERYMEGTGGSVAYRTITPGYFSALNIPILRGRGFREEDRNPNAHTIVLSQSLAKKLFGTTDALGQQLQFGSIGPWYAVVGVVADVKNGGLAAAPDPEYYVARTHSPDHALRGSSVLVRTSLSARATAPWLRSEIAALDPTLPVTIETMDQRVGKLAQKPRFNAALLSLFAGRGLLLAVVGIYGVVSFLVTQRTQEIGVRMALGATPGDILRLVSGRSMRPVLVGVLLGLVCAMAASRLLTTLLFEVRPDDPLTFAAVALLLVATSLLATYLPARRATKVDPMVALRYE